MKLTSEQMRKLKGKWVVFPDKDYSRDEFRIAEIENEEYLMLDDALPFGSGELVSYKVLEIKENILKVFSEFNEELIMKVI